MKLNVCVSKLFSSSIPEVGGLKVSGAGVKFMLMFCHQYEGQNCDIKIANSFFDNMAMYKYFGVTQNKTAFMKN